MWMNSLIVVDKRYALHQSRQILVIFWFFVIISHGHRISQFGQFRYGWWVHCNRRNYTTSALDHFSLNYFTEIFGHICTSTTQSETTCSVSTLHRNTFSLFGSQSLTNWYGHSGPRFPRPLVYINNIHIRTDLLFDFRTYLYACVLTQSFGFYGLSLILCQMAELY